jgi:hypothetical protein
MRVPIGRPKSRSRRVWMRLVFVVLTLGAIACSDAGTGDRSGDQDLGVGRGSKACRDWQDAICDYASDRCEMFSRKACDLQYQGATCKSDAVASRCAAQLDAASCGRAPESCVLDVVGDPGPAARACDGLFDAFCERSVSCGVSESNEACRAEPEVQAIDCGQAIAYRLDYERCLDETKALECELLLLPEVCDNVIILHD